MTLNRLCRRGIEVADHVRERVGSCTDLDRLTTSSQRAVHATAADDLFAGE
ncbi:hypothetical protein ACFYO5_37145 [Streptomyces sp. NPDC006259]|uniref:hypothetical protein n=1 Tax=Streptomyces sp. NPDC006259 TaxID=3364740 RepID=UPI0036A2319A